MQNEERLVREIYIGNMLDYVSQVLYNYTEKYPANITTFLNDVMQTYTEEIDKFSNERPAAYKNKLENGITIEDSGNIFLSYTETDYDYEQRMQYIVNDDPAEYELYKQLKDKYEGT